MSEQDTRDVWIKLTVSEEQAAWFERANAMVTPLSDYEVMQLRGAILWMDECAALIARSLATLAKAIEAKPDLAANLAGTLNELRQAAEAAIVAMDTIRALLGRAVFIGHDETDNETLQ